MATSTPANGRNGLESIIASLSARLPVLPSIKRALLEPPALNKSQCHVAIQQYRIRTACSQLKNPSRVYRAAWMEVLRLMQENEKLNMVQAVDRVLKLINRRMAEFKAENHVTD